MSDRSLKAHPQLESLSDWAGLAGGDKMLSKQSQGEKKVSDQRPTLVLPHRNCSSQWGTQTKSSLAWGNALPWMQKDVASFLNNYCTSDAHCSYGTGLIFENECKCWDQSAALHQQAKLQQGKEGPAEALMFCRNLCFSTVMWTNKRHPPLNQTPNHIQSSHSSWSDMKHYGDSATRTTVGETCSFHCCISLCIHSYEWSRGGEHLRLAIMSPTV